MSRIDELRIKVQKGMGKGNGFMAWIENSVLNEMLTEVERLTNTKPPRMSASVLCLSDRNWKRWKSTEKRHWQN